MGGDPRTISGLSGIGDLMLTCFGDLSRNRTCGMRLAKVASTNRDILLYITIKHLVLYMTWIVTHL
jgi:glycerol-3-phosphate dehydrogenase